VKEGFEFFPQVWQKQFFSFKQKPPKPGRLRRTGPTLEGPPLLWLAGHPHFLPCGHRKQKLACARIFWSSQ
jgi:hypothetical protein